MAGKKIKPDDLLIHVLNVGFGDNIIVEFPVDNDGKRSFGLVDCFKGTKTTKYLDALLPNIQDRKPLKFICATHPHFDHICGIPHIMKHKKYCPEEFWDSGFRHSLAKYKELLETVVKKNIRMLRVSSGMEWYFGKVRITALSPAVQLRNRYATYGIDMNNASIVLRIEHNDKDSVIMRSMEYQGDKSKEILRKAGKSVAILAGDAEYDSWSYITQEYPLLDRTSTHKPLVSKMINLLDCSVIKVAHHGSMHSSPLDVYEKLKPKIAVISCSQEESTKKAGKRILTRNLFPHRSAEIALEEVGSEIITTDRSYENKISAGSSKPGSIVIVIPPGKTPWTIKLNDDEKSIPVPPPGA
ncbi:MAG: MBL fold metallo-hydrolase [Candidatus Brocadiaceae bacterium]|nr:MBL fold metallo-hydrolase [Candidatus Brocadiaceae bacterium]